MSQTQDYMAIETLPKLSTQRDKLCFILHILKVEHFIHHRIVGDFHRRIVEETIKGVFEKYFKKYPKVKRLTKQTLSLTISGNPIQQKLVLQICLNRQNIVYLEYPLEVLIKPYLENCFNLDVEEKLKEFLDNWVQNHKKTLGERVWDFLKSLWSF